MLMLVKDKGGEGKLLSYKAHINFDDRVNFSQHTRGPTWLTIDGMAHHNDDYHGSRGVHCKWKVAWDTAEQMAEWEAAINEQASVLREHVERQNYEKARPRNATTGHM